VIRLTQLAISKRSVTVLITARSAARGPLLVVLAQAGAAADIQLPIVVVITPLPGASAQDVSTQVTDPIERSIGNTSNLKTVDSSSVNSLSLVVACSRTARTSRTRFRRSTRT